MTIPADEVEIPQQVRELAGDAALECVWRNDYGGLTFKATPPCGEQFYIKYGPRNAEFNFADEAERMTWAGHFIRAPEVIEVGQDHTHEWLVTKAIDGESAVAPRWVANPATAVKAVGAGLRAMHDALPVDDCPWDWSVEGRIANAEARGIAVRSRFAEASDVSVYELGNPPPIDKLVVCHADACCPNTLLDNDGNPLAHVDLALLGTADRWADIAVAAMSTEWNYGPGWEDALIAAYGVEPDRERLRFYRGLWNAT